MNRVKRFCGLVILILVFSTAAACSRTNDYPTPAENLQASVNVNWTQYQMEHGIPGGGMAVYLETPTGNYFASSGMADGVNQHTRFRIASNTKTFTSAAIMLLEQEGKLHLDDTIVSLIPGQVIPYVPATDDYSIPNKDSITIRQLLSHIAGVYDITNEYIPDACPVPYAGQSYEEYIIETEPNHQFSPGELVGVIATCQLSYFLPETDYHYSNQGYSILSTIIQRVSGMDYDQFVIQNLILPNGLTSTTVPMLGDDQTIPSPFSHGFLYKNGVLTDVTLSNMSLNIAEGNIISTPVDLACWVKRLIKGEAGPNQDSVDAMKTLTSQSGGNYGLGIFYINGLGYGHNGAHPGYMSLMVYDPAVDVTTILYFNIWDDANLSGSQAQLLIKAAKDARAAVGY